MRRMRAAEGETQQNCFNNQREGYGQVHRSNSEVSKDVCSNKYSHASFVRHRVVACDVGVGLTVTYDSEVVLDEEVKK